MSTLRILVHKERLRGVGLDDLSTIPYEWNEIKPPWSYTNESEFLDRYPSTWNMPPVRDLASGSTFRQRILNTVAAGRCIVRLPAGVFHLTSFPAAADNIMYAFGFWHRDLAGFIGKGPDKTFIQMDANSLSQAQLNGISEFTAESWATLNIGMMRIDGDQASPAVLAGVTIRADDQQIIESFAPDNLITGNQPAPHRGVTFFRKTLEEDGYFYQSHVRYQGAARAATSRPPFECANWDSQYSVGYSHRIESDGRRSPDLDPLRPRRCSTMMGNNETISSITDGWLHHSNVSRYAVNDQNRETSGAYSITRVLMEQITNQRNVDPALNNGVSLRGWTDASPFGWESINGTVHVENTIISQDNPNPVSGFGQIPVHFQLTHVGSRNPRGGRFYATDNYYRWPAHPHLNGFCGFRISESSFWWQDGFNNTINVTQDGTRLLPYVVEGAWPPTLAALNDQGVKPATHYLVRRA